MAKKEVTAYSQKIAELGGTIPENLPTPEKSAKALKKSLVYLFFFRIRFCAWICSFILCNFLVA